MWARVRSFVPFKRVRVGRVAVLGSMFVLAACAPGGGCAPAPPAFHFNASCARPNFLSWVHFDQGQSHGYKPNAFWQVVDSPTSTTVSSPVGDAEYQVAFAADPGGFFHNPTEVANFFFANGVTNPSIIAETGPYSANGGLQQDFEFVANDNGQLFGVGVPVRGYYRALYISAGAASVWVAELYLAHADVAAAQCGTVFEIHDLLHRT
jgi:hypothetical protein